MSRRRPVPLLVSIVVHIVVAYAIMNAAFHYDFSRDRVPRPPSPPQEHITYVTASPPAGALTGIDSARTTAKAKVPTRAIVAPMRVPTSIAPPPAPPDAGTPGGVLGGQGRGGGVGATTGIVPAEPDPRLSNDPHAFYPEPKTHAERVDSAVRASIYAYNDSVARALALAGKKPGDWTFEKNGQKWGIDGNKIYLGKFAIPSAVLAALPIHIQGNPGESIADRLSTTRRADLLTHAASAYHDDEFKTAVKRIRERKDRERKEKQQTADGDKPVANPALIP
jgi:hypothetical protein